MDNRVYLWLFGNIAKYDFVGAEALEIKNSFSRMLITEESLASDAISNQMRVLYEKFISLFYNNIYGYKNGFACKAITSAHLDCYFIKTPDGFVPIGYYKQVRPSETVMIVQNYLEQSKNDIKNEKNQIISIWQNKINDISLKFDRMKNSGTPSVIKAILGGVAALLLLVFVIISFINLDVIGAILTGGTWVDVNIPLISNAGFVGFAIYSVFVLIAFAIAVIDIIFVIKEIMLFGSKGTTKNLLETIYPNVSNLEQSLQFELNQIDDNIVDAARSGGDAVVTQSKCAFMLSEIEKKFKKASDFLNNSKRKGMGLALIIISFVIVFLGIITYIQPLSDALNGIFASDTVLVAEPTEEPTEEPTYEPLKESTYSVIRQDVDWFEANSKALDREGHLVYINDKEEFDKVCKMADDAGIIVFWVGARRAEYENWNEITWQDGTEFSYIPWLEDEPSYYSEAGNAEEYLMVLRRGEMWYFNDSENDAIAASANTYAGKIGYIIEYEG